MNSEETGIVRLEDLPSKEIFVKLKLEFHNIVEDKIREFGIEKFGKKICSGRKIGHWLQDGSLIRFDILIKILDYFQLDYKNGIDYIRGELGYGIKNPKFPFDLTSCQGVRIISGILGDGGIPTKRHNPYYTNSDMDLINGFIEDMRFVFGDLEFGSRSVKGENSLTIVLGFSSLIEKIFLKLGLMKGKKVIMNPSIPPFIFDLSADRKYAFVSQFIDDEGSINKVARHIAITAGCLDCYKFPNILKDLRILLLSLGIDSAIRQDKIGSSFKNKNTVMCRLQINGQFQLRDLFNNLNLRISRKRYNLELLIQSFKRRVFRRKECLFTYIDIIKSIEYDKGFFTSLDLSKESGMVVGSCRNTIIKFRENGLIKCVKPYSRYPHMYARYVLNENGNYKRPPTSL